MCTYICESAEILYAPAMFQIDGEPDQKKPRQTGSMVSHHDDIVTRMKNVDMIEIGRHRIKPWYFSPYPQVGACNLKESGL